MLAIIDCGTSELESIISNIQKLGFEYSVITLPEIPSTDFYLFSHIIISGAPTILTEVGPERYIELFTFLEAIEIPILGICLGHQIIWLLYGAEISRGKYIEKMEPLEILEEDILFDGIGLKYTFISHPKNNYRKGKDKLVLDIAPPQSIEQ